jgi:hypothetical protein
MPRVHKENEERIEMSQKKNVPKEKPIPKEKIQDGIAISLDKSQRHLDCSELLIEKGFLENAVDTVEHAIEEFGRAVYLRERKEAGLESIEIALEKDHWLKYNKAFSVLPQELKTIWENTISPASLPEAYTFTGSPLNKETISPDTRPDAIFTYYNEKTQSWQNGIMADKEKMMYIVNEMREYIVKFKF